MSGEDRMPKIDPNKLKTSDLNLMKIIELQNLERVKKLQRLRRNNIISGCLLGAGVISIYAYTILSVKQERFLDDFDEPAKIIEK
ncbi:hypothetical protein RI129_008479 [Pyrocoelia pectoralis]|uniref:Cytochrome c oxidase assembly factor 3 n=1 Tax=Pyrocoelia pectoralis TaxID=417401 RepID=A0AAN7V7E8_9COLE